jgi:NurA domain
MASFIDLVAQSMNLQREEFLARLSSEPVTEIEHFLATRIQAHWHPLVPGYIRSAHQPPSLVGAVDGSRAVRALNIGADWIVAQALLIGSDGHRLPAVETRLLRGEIEHPAVDRFASLLMRSLELKLALDFVQSRIGNILLLDGSLYADLPYLLYNLPIGGYEDLPIKVLEQYLELFNLCQKHDVLLLGIAKSTRSTILGRALLDSASSGEQFALQQADTLQGLDADVQKEALSDDSVEGYRRKYARSGSSIQRLPTDGELLYRWTKGCGLTNPVLLGSASFGHESALSAAKLASQAKQSLREPQSTVIRDRLQERLSPIQERLLAAPAIGTFYVRLSPGEDVLRVDALASTFGRDDIHLLEFAQTLAPYTTALPIVQHLQGEYGGLSVYNAALYVVDQEVRLHAETVDHVYLQILRHQLGHPVQYDRSTRRFIG